MAPRTTPRVTIENRQRIFRIDPAALRQLVRALADQAAAARADAPPWREVILILLDDAGIEAPNRAIMRHQGATDVITQAYAPLPGEPAGLTGELFVNVERAWQVGARRGGSPARELALYVAHGCDHLNDEEDATAAGRRRMRRREWRWLSRVRVPAGLVKRL